jgi:hypothetical protein
MKKVIKSLNLFVLLILIAVTIGCDSNNESEADQILRAVLADIGPFQPIQLDTKTLASSVQDGESIQLPFVKKENILTRADVQLTLRNLRNADLTEAYIKDEDDQSFEIVPLEEPATYQGMVVDKPGVAVFTINDQVIEGNILMDPEGWSIIEPIEPLLRQRGVDEADRQVVLKKYNHIAYNVRDRLDTNFNTDADILGGLESPLTTTEAGDEQLVMSAVADGDSDFYRLYPPDSVMPFWLKEEALLNVIDWQFNCIEPEQNEHNSYALCDNDFDGGSNGFQARVRIDRLEVWKAGGPKSTEREALLRDSIRMTHQSDPPCCGEPHTAGRSDLVYFFSGRNLEGGTGVAARVGGLSIYDGCFEESLPICHHALSQFVPNEEFPATVYFQEILVAHEIGHVVGGEEQINPFPNCWLFDEQCGINLMGSIGFNTQDVVYIFTEEDAQGVMGPLLQERLSAE